MRKHTSNQKRSLVIFALMMVLACAGTAFAGVNIVIINTDGPGEGFNDPTPVAPVGGNAGTTLGQQRQIAFQHAASIWGATLDSNQTVYIQAAFNPLAPGVLGSAGSPFVFRDFPGVGLYPGAEFPQTWYGSALADKRAGLDKNPNAPDILAQFSSNFNFYLGLDNNHGPLNDLVTVLLHEFAHGLNFQNFVTEQTGASPQGLTDIFSRHTLDTSTNQTWDQMTAAQMAASAIRYGRVVWTGNNVSAGVPSVLLFGSTEFRVLSPAPVAGAYQSGPASFGPVLSTVFVSGNVEAATDAADAAGPATTDGCSPFTNAAAVSGKIALIERGTCGFTVKVKNAQNAGAIGAIIYNNVANVNAAPGVMGTDAVIGPTITIPSVNISRADGLAIVAQMGSGVSANLGNNPGIRAGTDLLGRVRIYMPFPVSGGSSGSHYDTIANRNLLMEPFISGNLTHNVKAPDDLTLELLRDVGWFPDADLDGVATEDDCDDTSNFSPTVIIGGCDTGVLNATFTNGCKLADLFDHVAEGAGNHGQFVSGVAHLTNQLRKAGTISEAQKTAIRQCAAKASIP